MNEAAGVIDDLLIAQLEIERLSDSLRMMQAELEASRRRLAKSEQAAAIGQVSVAIVQEFNDPLQALSNILGGIQRRGRLEPDDVPLLDLAYDEVTKLTNLIGELREFYQPTRSKTELVDLQIELESVIAASSQKLSDQGVRVTTEYADQLPPIPAVAEQLRAVFQWLLDHALATCRRDDRLHFAASRDGNSLVVQMEERVRMEERGSRSGLPSVPHFFEPPAMSLAKKSAKSLHHAKCHAFLLNHGGTIAMEPGCQGGCSVRLILPICGIRGISGMRGGSLEDPDGAAR